MTHLAQVTLLTAGADSADNQSNGFYISDSGVTESTLDAWAVAIRQFYIDCKAAGAMRGLAQNNHIIKFYDVLTEPPNYPVYETTWNFDTAPGAMDLPPELCLAVSYKNNSQNTILRARRRGRIYISGWGEAQNTTGRPTSTAYDGLANAMQDYCDAVNVISGFTAVIYSRAQFTTTPIEEVWCDNAWDTQRRRGEKPTVRTSLPVVP